MILEHLLEFENWWKITVHQYFNPIANIVASKEGYTHKSWHQHDSTRSSVAIVKNFSRKERNCWKTQNMFEIFSKKSMLLNNVNQTGNCGKRHHALLQETKKSYTSTSVTQRFTFQNISIQSRYIQTNF